MDKFQKIRKNRKCGLREIFYYDKDKLPIWTIWERVINSVNYGHFKNRHTLFFIRTMYFAARPGCSYFEMVIFCMPLAPPCFYYFKMLFRLIAILNFCCNFNLSPFFIKNWHKSSLIVLIQLFLQKKSVAFLIDIF